MKSGKQQRWITLSFRIYYQVVNRHSTVTHYQRPNMTHPQEGGTGGEVSEILFFSAKSKRRPSLIYSMQIIPVCLSIVARRKGVFATRRGGLNWTPISLLVGHPCKLFHIGFWAHRTRPPRISRALSRLTKPMFWKAEREIATLTERRAAGAARPASVACQTSRFRYWLP